MKNLLLIFSVLLSTSLSAVTVFHFNDYDILVEEAYSIFEQDYEYYLPDVQDGPTLSGAFYLDGDEI